MYFLFRFLEEEDENATRAYNHTIIDEETISEDEATLEKMEDFETKYRFRYEIFDIFCLIFIIVYFSTYMQVNSHVMVPSLLA